MNLERLNEELKRMDKRLECRYNGIRNRYEVTGVDAKNIRYRLYEIPLGQLDLYAHQVIEGIRKARHFTAKERLAMIEDQEKQDELAAEKRIADDIDYAVAESYDRLKRMEGLRITLPDKGFEFQDRRRIKPEGE